VPYRLFIIPFLLVLLALAGIIGSISIDIPDLKKSGLDKLLMVESHSNNEQFRWSKAKEIISTETNLTYAQAKTLKSGINVFICALVLVAFFMICHLFITYKWVKDNWSKE